VRLLKRQSDLYEQLHALFFSHGALLLFHASLNLGEETFLVAELKSSADFALRFEHVSDADDVGVDEAEQSFGFQVSLLLFVHRHGGRKLMEFDYGLFAVGAALNFLDVW